MQERRTEKWSQRDWDREALDLLRGFAPQLQECRWCRGPNVSGYVCHCGWDNSYDPDKYAFDPVAEQYVKKVLAGP